MKKFIVALLAVIVAIAGIEPVALQAAEKGEIIDSEMVNVSEISGLHSLLNHEELPKVVRENKVVEGSETEIVIVEEESPMLKASAIASGKCGAIWGDVRF